jgi:hypothetical protein
MQVHALKIQEVSGISGGTETQIVVEAETIFDVPAGGIYYANLVVTGVPLVPPTKLCRTLALNSGFIHQPGLKRSEQGGHRLAPALKYVVARSGPGHPAKGPAKNRYPIKFRWPNGARSRISRRIPAALPH